MPKTKHVVVVFKFAVNVPQFMQDAAALLSTITSPNAKKHIKITAKMVAQIKAHLKILSQKQTAVKSGGRGAVLLRDMAVTELQNDIRELVRLVQKKADETKDELEKIVVIKSCSMKIKKPEGARGRCLTQRMIWCMAGLFCVQPVRAKETHINGSTA